VPEGLRRGIWLPVGVGATVDAEKRTMGQADGEHDDEKI
jgi:hypothetical protein